VGQMGSVGIAVGVMVVAAPDVVVHPVVGAMVTVRLQVAVTTYDDQFQPVQFHVEVPLLGYHDTTLLPGCR
jgi:hypothetical protein